MRKLPIGTKLFDARGTEYKVTKNGNKYITVSKEYTEYKCQWEDGGLVYKSDYSVLYLFNESKYQRLTKVNEIREVVESIKKSFPYYVHPDTDINELEGLLKEGLSKINEYKKIINHENY